MEAGLLWFNNWSMLGVCTALKLPQIYSQLAVCSARGIGFLRLLLELAGFLIFLCYQHYYGNPLLTYLAYPIPILIAQDIALMLFVFHFNGNIKQALPYMAIFVSSWFILSLQKWIINLAMNLCTVISASSKFAQLQYLWKAQGAVSALTWGLFAYTCATRIITTLLTTNDLTILIRFVIMLALNIWVTAMVLHYRKSVTKAE